MNFTGKVSFVSPVTTGVSQSGKEWASLNFVVTNDQDRYPRTIYFRLFGQERINEAALKVGDCITVDFDIDAHEYNGRWFNELNAWRITHIAVQQPQQASQQPQPPYTNQPQAQSQQPAQNNNSETLPF